VRTFQIRNVDKDGYGSFEYAKVDDSASFEDIKAAIEDAAMIFVERHRQRMAAPFFGMNRRPLRRAMHVRELVKNDEAGKWVTKHGGLHGKVELGYIKMTLNTGEVRSREWYTFEPKSPSKAIRRMK